MHGVEYKEGMRDTIVVVVVGVVVVGVVVVVVGVVVVVVGVVVVVVVAMVLLCSFKFNTKLMEK